MRRTAILVTAAAIAGATYAIAPAAHAATSSISGVAFYDSNRDGVLDNGEQPMASTWIYLYDSTGAYLSGTTTDSTGRYTFTGLAMADYTVRFDSSAWLKIRDSYYPTTTSGPQPVVSVNTSTGAATADFGWRPLVTSSDANTPIASYVGSNGLTVQVYNDAVSPKQIFDDLVSSGNVGAEAPYVTVRFGYGTVNNTTSSWGTLNGTFSDYQSTSYSTWDAWLDGGDQTLFHEYGHAWSMYFAAIVQQDPNLTGYLQARGILNDSRLGSSYAWSPRELVAEDFRQLFGTPNAKLRAQMNTDLPPASQVAGLADYLSGPFRTSSTSTSTGGSSTTPPPPSLTVGTPSVSPTPVKSSGTVSATISVPASVTIVILDSAGRTVSTILKGVSEAAGTVSATWGRTDSSGRRVKSGTYTASVTAVANGQTVNGTVSFGVS